jgi:soluble lytic murein transglycosylase
MLEVRSAKRPSCQRTPARFLGGCLILAGGFLALTGCAGTGHPPKPAADARSAAPPVSRATPTNLLSAAASLPEITGAEEGFSLALQAYQGGAADVSGLYAQSVIRSYPDSPWKKRALFLLGKAYLARGMTAEAEAVMLRMPAEYPELADYALFALAESYAATQRWTEAAALYQRLIDGYPSSLLESRAQLRRGQVLLDAGLLPEAAAAFDTLLKDQPWSDEAPDAALGLGKARANAGDLAGAVRAYRMVTVKYPSPERDQAAEKALAALRNLSAPVPDLTAAEWYERGKILARQSQYEKAQESYRRALEADPAHPQKADLMLRSGIALFNLGRRADAASTLERLIKAKLPDCRCAEAYAWLGKSYSRLGLRDEAVETYGKLVRLYPDSDWADDALYYAGNVLRDAGDMRQAVKYYRRLVAEYPDSSFADSALWWEGWELFVAGDYRKAEQAFQEIVRRYPRSFLVNQALYWKGRAAELRGDRDQAARSWRRVMTRGPYTYYGYRTAERITGEGPAVREAAAAAEPVAAAAPEENDDPAVDGEPDGFDGDGPPDWTEDAFAALAQNSVYRRTRELMYLGLQKDAAAELWSLQEQMPRRQGALMGLSKTFFQLGDYHSSLVIVVRNFDRALERPSQRLPGDLWMLAYPQGYWTSIVTHARKYGLDPFFVAAIIREESQFRPDAVSPAGARGVMQVLPTTGEWAARNAGMADFERSRLLDPDVNIAVGTWYLAHLMKRFQGNMVLVSAAYNAGPEAVAAWTGRNGSARDPATFVELIPYTETRGYVKKVLRNHAEYRRIYAGTPAAVLSGVKPSSGPLAAPADASQWCRAAGGCP